MPEQLTISVDQLRIGLYVYLDVKWFEHPFAFNNFKIKSEDQIAIIHGLGLKSVRWDPERSDLKPAPKAVVPAESQRERVASAESQPKPTVPTEAPSKSVVPVEPQPKSAAPAEAQQKTALSVEQQSKPVASAEAPPKPAASAEPQQKISPALQAKRALIERIKEQREVAARIEGAFVDTAATIRSINKNLFVRPAETVSQATKLVTQIADSILSAPELAVYLMGDKVGGEEMYFHSLNVTMLSLMMARDIRLPPELVGVLGMGAMFHDVGRSEIPDRILLKTDPWTKSERELYELHCQYGVEMGKRLHLAPGAIAIIQDHHELYDGSGYPRHLAGESVGLLSRMLAIVNYYDNLCNPYDIANALTPHEALSLMFAKLRGKFDPKLLQVIVRCLGVYPPGTIVQLSNGVLGMVATINAARPMKPTIVIYDADVPKEDAILVDMDRETDVNIAKAIRPAQLPLNIYNYLSPRKHVSYYFDARHPEKSKGPK
jgi:putative nucleotidyltransferase with HDIG domain